MLDQRRHGAGLESARFADASQEFADHASRKASGQKGADVSDCGNRLGNIESMPATRTRRGDQPPRFVVTQESAATPVADANSPILR